MDYQHLSIQEPCQSMAINTSHSGEEVSRLIDIATVKVA